MPVHRALFVLSVALFGLASAFPALAQECSECGGTGETRCKRHRPPLAFALRHSAFLDQTCCLGTGNVPCRKCDDTTARGRYDERKADLEKWVLSRRRDFDEKLFSGERGLGDLVGTLRHAETENFRLAATSPALPVMACDVPEGLFAGLPSKSRLKKRFPPDQYDWIVLKRAEDAFNDFKELFQHQGRFQSSATPYVEDPCPVAKGKYDLFLWHHTSAQRVCSRKFLGLIDDKGVYKHGTRWSVVVGGQPQTNSDEGFHRYETHVLHHLFIEALDFQIGFDMPCWVEEGFAHYMEWKKFGSLTVTCYFERPAPVKVPRQVMPFVRKTVAGRKDIPAATLIEMKYSAMDAKAHCQVFSLMHYLIEDTPRDKFVRFIREIKRSRDQMTSFKTAYGYSLVMIDEPWREFVTKNYR